MDNLYQESLDTVQTILKDFKEIDAVLLSGSMRNNSSDIYSDIDLYVYLNNELDVDKRTKFISSIADTYEIDNQFWETEDCFTLKDSGVKVELIYRSYTWIHDQLVRVMDNFEASVGYSTCFCRNFLDSEILFDNSDNFLKLQQQFSISYPKELQKNIIAKNFPLLKNIASSYYNQLSLAIKREDIVSINHRVSAFLDSYFDIIFAINMIYHPGEKKLLKIVQRECDILPKGFEEDLKKLLKLDSKAILDCISQLTDNLENIIP